MRNRSLGALCGAALCALLVALATSSCSEKLAKRKGLADRDLFALGRSMMEKKKFADAVEPFRLLLERFPNSPLAPAAQLALADARAAEKEFVEAEAAYDDFLRLYPASDNVPYALFRKGELLFAQIAPPQRDQSKTADSLAAFTRLVANHPGSPFAPKARERIAQLRTRLAEHEEVVVLHYLRRKQFDSAEARARRALEEYSDTPAAPRLMAALAAALEKQGRRDDARAVRKALSEKFPESGAKPK